MRPPYHVAFVLTSFQRGGMEMRLVDVINGLDKTRWNPHVYAFYAEKAMQGAIPPERLHLPLSKWRGDVLTPLRLRGIFRQHSTPILWALGQGLAAGWGRLGGLLGSVPIRVLSIHDNFLLAPTTRLLNPWTDAIVTVSRDSARRIAAQGVPENKLHVLYNGLDTDRYQPGEDERVRLFDIPPTRPVILNIGRLAHEKGRDIMLRAAQPLMTGENPPLLVFAGDGVERPNLKKLAEELGIAGQVRFLGVRADVPDLLRAADVVVMSSRDVPFGESCPNIVLEGMATALPVVGTRVGGTDELIQEGETGFVIPPDNPAALTEKLALLLANPGLRRDMGAAGRRRVLAHFSLTTMIQGREDLLSALLARKGLFAL